MHIFKNQKNPPLNHNHPLKEDGSFCFISLKRSGWVSKANVQ